MKEKLQKLTSDYSVECLLFLIIALQPVIDMDYLIYDTLNAIGLPRPSTIIRLLIIPMLVLWAWIRKDQNKKKTAVFAISYVLVLGVFFVIHHKVASELYSSGTLYLTNNFKYMLSYEALYCFTLVIPYFVIYLVYQVNWKEDVLKKMFTILSASISFPIIISDIFLFGRSTYVGYTAATIFDWFNPQTYVDYIPRAIACKFFFSEGNTIGIVLMMILPMLYYFFLKEENKKWKIGLGIVIFAQSIAMLILSTRIATYCAVLIPVVVLVAYLFLCILKKEKFVKSFVIFTLLVTLVSGAILPHSPAYMNQKLNLKNNQLVLDDEYLRLEGKGALDEALEGKVPGTAEYNYALIYQFELYGIKCNLMSTLSKEYFMDYYYYRFDAPFWMGILMNDNFEVRSNGREFEKTFERYKWDILTSAQKFVGMGYSTFMNGSILVEADFEQQIYSYGYIGALLLVAPWLVILAGCGLTVLTHFKTMWNMKTFMLLMGLGMGMVAAYMSGHTLDQYMSTLVLATISAFLIKEIRNTKEVA